MNLPAAITLLLVLTVAAGCGHHPATSPAVFQPQPGDLLFHDLDGSPLADAIETVTVGYHDARLCHVGMVVSSQPQVVQVIEAIGTGVKITPLDRFLARSHDAAHQPKVLVGRLKPHYRPLIPDAITFALAQCGKPYDKLYRMDGSAYYCSSLIYDAFRHANAGRPLFPTAPMTFKDPATGQWLPVWTDYFAALKTPIPEGAPGVNPGAMSRDDCLEIIHAFGKPSRRP